MQNYFELFDLETSFFIDDDQLKSSYRKEISRFHPDKYATKSESEKLQALQNTSLLNTAFTSLKTPLNRASYLLKMQGLDPFDERDTVMNHDFLISQIDLREELEVIEDLYDFDSKESWYVPKVGFKHIESTEVIKYLGVLTGADDAIHSSVTAACVVLGEDPAAYLDELFS